MTSSGQNLASHQRNNPIIMQTPNVEKVRRALRDSDLVSDCVMEAVSRYCKRRVYPLPQSIQADLDAITTSGLEREQARKLFLEVR